MSRPLILPYSCFTINGASFIISCTVVVTNGFYHNEIPPVLRIICLICLFLSQLQEQRLWLPLLFASDLKKVSALLLGWVPAISPTISPGRLHPIFKSIKFCWSGDSFIFSQRERPWLCCQLALLTLCARHSQPGLHESSSLPRSIPAHPEGSRKPHKTAPLVSQTDHLRNLSSPVRNYKRAEVAFGNKRGRCFSFLPVPVTVRPGVRSYAVPKKLEVLKPPWCALRMKSYSVCKAADVPGLFPRSCSSDFHVTGDDTALAFRSRFIRQLHFY